MKQKLFLLLTGMILLTGCSQYPSNQYDEYGQPMQGGGGLGWGHAAAFGAGALTSHLMNSGHHGGGYGHHEVHHYHHTYTPRRFRAYRTSSFRSYRSGGFRSRGYRR